ncbi:MAG TPA: DUF4230 domain-containing protein [Anaeromyxobacteraceae bacterium]|nr:DUF4230 domain-containing protein [Anaeromyxobacteraceae bacterium]
MRAPPPRRTLASLAVVGLAAGAGLGLALRLVPRPGSVPDPPAIVERIREVVRLEVLDVRLYKKVSFAPDPEPSGTAWGDLAGWLRYTFHAPHGKAIVFADAHLAVDLGRMDASRLEVRGRTAWVALPPVRVSIELRPGETEVIGSTLDSAQTARLFELAKDAFEREVSADAALRARARASAERAVRALLVQLGFTDVHVADELPRAPGA